MLNKLFGNPDARDMTVKRRVELIFIGGAAAGMFLEQRQSAWRTRLTHFSLLLLPRPPFWGALSCPWFVWGSVPHLYG